MEHDPSPDQSALAPFVFQSLRRLVFLASSLVSLLLSMCWLVTVFSVSPLPAPASNLPTPTAVLAQSFARYRVANTGGLGVYIRRTPTLSDHIRAWQEGAVMEQVGADIESDGIRWRHVEDPDGNRGWVPSAYLQLDAAGPP